MSNRHAEVPGITLLTGKRVILFSAGFLAEVMTITPATGAFEKPQTLRVERFRLPSCNQLQTVRSPVGPHLSVQEAIVDSPEADVENQSSAMQRTRLS